MKDVRERAKQEKKELIREANEHNLRLKKEQEEEAKLHKAKKEQEKEYLFKML